MCSTIVTNGTLRRQCHSERVCISGQLSPRAAERKTTAEKCAKSENIVKGRLATGCDYKFGLFQNFGGRCGTNAAL